MTNEDKKTCAHEGCTCTAANDSSYCSANCETAQDAGTTTIACECGHSGCKSEIS